MDEAQLAGLEKRLQQLVAKRGTAVAKKASAGSEYAFRFLEEYAQWRYENPFQALAIRCVSVIVIVMALMFGLWIIADTGAGRATGLDGVRQRITDAFYAVMWAQRGVPGANGGVVEPERCSGTIEKVSRSYMVAVCYKGAEQVRRIIQPANVIITDEAGFAEWAQKYLLKGAILDFYVPVGKVGEHQVWGVVIWYRKVPINVELVEAGLGYPEKNPPTAVVNEIFSQYYWRKAKSGS